MVQVNVAYFMWKYVNLLVYNNKSKTIDDLGDELCGNEGCKKSSNIRSIDRLCPSSFLFKYFKIYPMFRCG